MPFFRLTLKRRLLDNKGRRVEAGMWVEVSHDKPYVNWASTNTLESVVSQFKYKYGVDLPTGKIEPNNFEVTRIS